jgi:hypothetical protein
MCRCNAVEIRNLRECVNDRQISGIETRWEIDSGDSGGIAVISQGNDAKGECNAPAGVNVLL